MIVNFDSLVSSQLHRFQIIVWGLTVYTYNILEIIMYSSKQTNKQNIGYANSSETTYLKVSSRISIMYKKGGWYSLRKIGLAK